MLTYIPYMDPVGPKNPKRRGIRNAMPTSCADMVWPMVLFFFYTNDVVRSEVFLTALWNSEQVSVWIILSLRCWIFSRLAWVLSNCATELHPIWKTLDIGDHHRFEATPDLKDLTAVFIGAKLNDYMLTKMPFWRLLGKTYNYRK